MQLLRIHIVAIDTGNEAQTIRAATECWQGFVTVTWVGNSGQIVDYFLTQPDHDLIIISGHGDERGLLLPVLADEVVDRYPYNEVIWPEDFDRFLRLSGNTVINLACLGGMKGLADVFLANGAGNYIGPIGYPNGGAALMYILEFLYQRSHRGHVVAEAYRIASNHDDDREQFKLYS